MKKKGFTLVELLATIVVLSVIALIATPIILNVIEKAKIGALESSVNGLVESANMYYANNTIKGETISETTFDFEDGEQVGTKKLEYKGKVYNGKLILHANGEVAICIDDEEHYAYKNKDTDEIVSGNGTCLYDGTTGDFSSNSSINDLRGKTLVVTTVTKSEDGLSALIKVPEEGHYNESSIISVPIETIQNEVSLNTITNSDTIVATANYADTSMSFTATVGKIYQIIKYGYQGTQSQNMSISSGATLIHSLTDTSNSGCIIYWVKATSTTVVMNLTTGQNSLTFAAEYNGTDDGSIFKNLTTLERIGRATQNISVPSNNSGYSMLLSLGYQGTQITAIGSDIISKEGTKILNYTISEGFGRGFGQLFVKGDISTGYTAYINHINHIIFCAY